MLATLGKVVIDATHSLDSKPGQLPALYVGFSDSLGEQVHHRRRRQKREGKSKCNLHGFGWGLDARMHFERRRKHAFKLLSAG